MFARVEQQLSHSSGLMPVYDCFNSHQSYQWELKLMKSKKCMIKSMIIKPDNLTKIMSILLHDPLCYDHSNYHSLNWPINNSSQYLCVPWWSIGMSNVTQYEFPNKTIEVWNSLFKYMFLMLLHHYQTICLPHILLFLFQLKLQNTCVQSYLFILLNSTECTNFFCCFHISIKMCDNNNN